MSISFRRSSTMATVGRPVARSKSMFSFTRAGVSVGAELKTGQPVLHVAARGGEDDRDVRRPLHRLERLADLPATLLGHHHVEENDIGKPLLRDRQRLL